MLHGYRWQLLALIVSIVLFASMLTYRLTNMPTNPQRDETTPVMHTASPTALAWTATPQPTQAPVTTISPVSTDSVLTFTEGIVGTVQTLNPLLATTQAERDVTSLIFDGLTQINQYGEVVPNLAELWQVSRDGYEYVFVLRQDIQWQDGMPFTVDDVILTYSLLGESDFPLAHLREFWQTVEIEKLDRYTLRFRLAQPLASFASRLTHGILPAHALQGIGASQLIGHPFNVSPIGTGAYQLEALRATTAQRIDGVDLRLSPTYQQNAPEATPTIERFRFRLFANFDEARTAFANRTINGLASRSKDERLPLLQLEHATVLTQVDAAVGLLIFNWNEDEDTQFFSDMRVRTALQLGLNRQDPIARALNNQAILADSPLRPNSWAYDDSFSMLPPNPERTMALLQTANITVPEGTDFGDRYYRFSILIPDEPALTAIAQNIANQWSQFNLDVTIEALNDAEYQQRLQEGHFDAAIIEYPLDPDPDMFIYWHADQYPDGLNYGAIDDFRISAILERGRLTTTNLSRVTIYHDFQKQFASRAIAIPLYYPLYTYVVQDNVQGVQLSFMDSPTARFRTISDWRIDER